MSTRGSREDLLVLEWQSVSQTVCHHFGICGMFDKFQSFLDLSSVRTYVIDIGEFIYDIFQIDQWSQQKIDQKSIINQFFQIF